MPKFTIELGSEVKSDVSGFTGIVTSRAEHLNGCNRYWVAPKVGKDGKMPDGSWIDEPELIAIKEPKVKRFSFEATEKRGGFPSRIK